MRDKVIFNVASFKRGNTLIKTIESIYNQADIINVSLNSYDDIPVELYDKKINLFITDNEKGDAYKFIDLVNSEGYFLTIDDDLIYPKDYAQFIISKIESFNRKKIVTLHGRKFTKFPVRSYYDGNNTEVFHFNSTILGDHKIQFGGTGVMGFHTELFKVGIDYFKYPNMADVWIGKYAKENNIDIIFLGHEIGYIKQQKYEDSIYDKDLKSDSIQTSLVNDTYVKKDLTVIIPTFNTTDYLDECIESLINGSESYDIEILVGIDGCEKTLNYVKNKKYHKSVKFYFFTENNGPYLIKNSLVNISKSDYILFFDSDDIVKKELIPFVNNNKNKNKFIKLKYENFGDESHDGKKISFGEGVFAINKELFKNLNGFEPWVCAADSDFMRRIYKNFENEILYSKEILFRRRVHKYGLTKRDDTGIKSKLRQIYVELMNEKNDDNLNPNQLNVKNFIEVANNYEFYNNLEVLKIEKTSEKPSIIYNDVKLETIPKPELTKKQINYDKINSIFQNNNPKVILQQQPKQETGNLRLNSETFSKIQRPKKRLR